MSLRMRARQTEIVHAHLCSAYPDEGCGVLLGRAGEEGRDVEDVVPIENRRGDSRHNRYLIAPEQFLEADRTARARGLDVIGFFHSHPDHPAQPSAFDLEHAWPYYSYLIVSVESGQAVDARSWRLAEDRSGFQPEIVEILPEADRIEQAGDTR